MKNQTLSINQMQHLRSLGVDTSKASIYWARRSHGSHIDDDSKGKWFLSLQKDFMVCGFTSYEVVSTFTLQDIIELLPNTIELIDHSGMRPPTKTANTFMLRINKGDKGNLYFSYVNDKYGAVSFDGKPMDAAYQTICWCAENGYLKGGKK